MTKLAFCGLGLLGRPIATRRVEAGHDVTVWNRTPDKAAPLLERGARWAATPREAAAGAEGAVTVLSTPEVLEEVLFGPDGLAAGMASGSLLVEMSTVGPDAIEALAPRLPEGVEMVDAPVLGSVPQATEGTLNIFVGGTGATFERLRPLLEELGRPRHVGPLGSGAAMKLTVNSTLGPMMAALGEALALADAFGLDQGMVLDVLVESALGTTTRSKRGRIESGVYEPNFRLEMALKDSVLINEAAARRGRSLPVARAVREVLAGAEREGLGDLDYSAVIAHIRGAGASGRA
jgi:3-hydroxyisobutyrate dehydrogenase-like beta-hydroxyacid dehydrogenase